MTALLRGAGLLISIGFLQMEPRERVRYCRGTSAPQLVQEAVRLILAAALAKGSGLPELVGGAFVVCGNAKSSRGQMPAKGPSAGNREACLASPRIGAEEETDEATLKAVQN